MCEIEIQADIEAYFIFVTQASWRGLIAFLQIIVSAAHKRTSTIGTPDR